MAILRQGSERVQALSTLWLVKNEGIGVHF